MTDESLLPKVSVRAVHWLDVTKFPGGEVACGHAMSLTAAQWAERASKDRDRVTCKECHALAFPAPPSAMFGGAE